MSMLSRLTGNRSGATGVSGAIDTSNFGAALRRWWGQGHTQLEVLLKEETGLLAKALMTQSPPFAPGGGRGLSRSAFVNSKNKITRESKIVLKPLWMMPSTEIAFKDDFATFMKVRKDKIRFADKVGGAKGAVMQSFYKDKDPLNGFLRMQRMLKNKPPTGKVERYPVAQATYQMLRSQRTRGRITGDKRKVYFVEQSSSIKGSLAPAFERIGRLKSGWNSASMAITGNSISDVPVWITKHSGLGSGKNNLKDLYNPNAVLTNVVGNVWGMADRYGTIQRAFDMRTKALDAKVENYIRSLTKKGLPPR